MVFLKAVAITVNLKGHGHSETRLRKVVLIRFSCCPRIFATSSKSNSIPSARVFYREKNQTKSDVPLLLKRTFLQSLELLGNGKVSSTHSKIL